MVYASRVLNRVYLDKIDIAVRVYRFRLKKLDTIIFTSSGCSKVDREELSVRRTGVQITG